MNLYKGQVIKNYIELCKLLGVKPTRGKGRNYHIQEFERYCKYHKEGNKFVIDEVYPEPLPKIDNRIDNGKHLTKYDDLMDKVLINLAKDYGYIQDSFSMLMSELCFFKDKYVDLNKSGYKQFAKNYNLGVGITLTYQQKLNNVVKKCMETSLKRLHKKGIITYTKAINIREDSYNMYLADAEMEKLITNTEQQVYKEMDIKYYNRIIMEENRKFKNNVCNKLGIMTYYNVYCFELVDKNTSHIDVDEDELKRRLIQSVIDSVKNHNLKDSDGNKYKPYSYGKYAEQLDKLTKLLWDLPDGYFSEYDFKMALAGKETEEQQTTDNDDLDYMLDLYGYNEFYNYNEQDLKDCIPF